MMKVKKVLMLAAENGAVPRAKVGGMADVIRDLPAALASVEISTDVIMPSYGFLAQSVNAQYLASLSVSFAGEELSVMLFSVPHPTVKQCKIYFIEHERLESAELSIYSQGHVDRPFAVDATKFALFCLSVATALKEGCIELPDRFHLHDWHMGMFALLRALDPHFVLLKAVPCIFSVHNIALQGVRPLSDDRDSLAAWYPELFTRLTMKQKSNVIDVNYLDCINPMRAAIVLSDKVHLVSKTYAKEVLKPSNHRLGFFGGEGLEADLKVKMKLGGVVGILNGCVYDEPEYSLSPQWRSQLGIEQALLKEHYRQSVLLSSQVKQAALLPETRLDASNAMVGSKPRPATLVNKALPAKKQAWQSQCANWEDMTRLLFLAEQALLSWLAKSEQRNGHAQIALSRIDSLWRRLNMGWQPDFIMNSVGRLTDQKMLVLRQSYPQDEVNAPTVMEVLLRAFSQKRPNGLFILIGSGDEAIAHEFSVLAAKYPQFIFLNGYHEALADCVYRLGDLFLMPSSYEPCGISQMLAMRAGQICLVHGVGGLKDTVSNNKTGFVFKGAGLAEQSAQLLRTFDKALDEVGSQKWQVMQKNAKQQRFLWADIAAQYKTDLYGFNQQDDKLVKPTIRRVK